jgi:hypothetical protein
VSVAKPMDIPENKAYFDASLPVFSLMLLARKITDKKIKKLKNGSIIPDLKYKKGKNDPM